MSNCKDDLDHDETLRRISDLCNKQREENILLVEKNRLSGRSIKKYKINVRNIYKKMLDEKSALAQAIRLINTDVKELAYECSVRKTVKKEMEKTIEEKTGIINFLESKIKEKEMYCGKKCAVIACPDNGWNKTLSDAKENIKNIKKEIYERSSSFNQK